MSTPDDQDLEDFLKGQSDLARRYRASNAAEAQAEPSVELDQAILARARAAVERQPATVTPLPARKHQRWKLPLALAASVLLTFAVYREAGQKVGVTGDVSTRVVTEQSVAPASAPVPGQTAAQGEPPVKVSVLEPTPAEIAAIRPPPPPPAARPADAVVVARDEVAQKAVELRAAAPVAAASPPPAAILVPAPEAIVTTVGPVVSESLSVASGTVISPPSPTPQSNVARAARAPAAQRASAEAARMEADAAKAQRTPEAWLEDVRKLRAAGQGTRADEELKRFLAAYPDYFTQNPGIARP